MNKSICIIFAIVISHAAAAQKVWTYADCIAAAFDSNMDLKDFEYLFKDQRLVHRQTLGRLLPSISATTGYGLHTGRATDPRTNDVIEGEFFANQYGLEGNLQLFNGFRQNNRIAFERYNMLAARETFEREKNALAFLVLEAYIDHLAQSGLARIRSDQVALSEKEVYRIRKRIELGLASGSELHEAEARLAEDKFLLIQLQNSEKKSILLLKQMMNLPADSAIVIAGIEEYRSVASRPLNDTVYAIARSHLPQIKSLQMALRASEKNVKAAKGSLLPSLYLYGFVNSGYYGTFLNETGEVAPFSHQMGENVEVGYGLSLQIPLFDGFYRQLDVQRTKVARDQRQNALNIGLRNLQYEVDEALLDLEGAGAEYAAAVQRAESMELAFKIAEKKREKGLIGMMEFSEAKNNLAEAEAEKLRTKLQLFLKERTIDFYLTGSLTR